MKYQATRRILTLLTTLLPAAALAQTGVSDDRVSLPEGPGSLEGVGENVEIDPNMGMMRYSVKVSVPQGFPGMTPGVGLSYSSGSGGSVAGMGWSLSMPNIERSTARGLPEYDVDDGFAADGGDQLVYVEGTDPRIYRSRFEKGFVRYLWHAAGDGTEGYWTAEYSDGRIGTFGAEADGTLVPDSRVSGAGGTFRYHLVEMADRYGHKIRYDYSTFDGNFTLVQRIGWVHDGNGDPTYYVTFAYEDRNDLLSDCKAGFNELLDKRLSRVNVFAHGQRIRYYDLSYEDYAESGGFTRLVGVQMHGLDGTPYPVHESFEYSRGLGAQCTGDDCVKPYTMAMGSLGVDLQSGDATLLDINGDALPDVIDTSRPGEPHRIFLNVLTDNGDGTFSHAFQMPALESAIGAQDSHDLSSPYCQVMDVDGDGFTDLINSQTGDVLKNLGGGDWDSVYSLWSSGDGGAPDLNGDFDPSDGELRTVRFIDYDNDKRIDLIRSVGSGASNTTTVFRNIGDGGFQSDDLVDALEAGFESDNLELNDMNGDGLLDAVQVTVDTVRYRLNLGWGHWEPWVEIAGFDFTDQEKVEAELEDLNGDALADLVLVAGNQVRYWINRNGDSFDPEQVISSADIDGEIPVRDASVTVLYADMNGNGSSDVLWITSSGDATYLELFPVRPNLMSRVENGMGKVTEVGYGTSVEQQARDGGRSAWAYSLPHPMVVVTRYDEWDELTDVHQVTSYIYHDGYYDGKEKQFRGYQHLELLEEADESSEESLTLETHDVGATDAYRNGLLLTREVQSDGRSLELLTYAYEDCDVEGVPDSGLLFPVRHVCMVSETTERREGRPAVEHATVETRYEYDGYGNPVLTAELGVTALGSAACAACVSGDYSGTPCGPQCLGDESYTRIEYAVPADNANRWIIDRSVRKRVFGVATAQGEPASDLYAETRYYYDGEPFTGLPAGQLTHGSVSRVTERVTVAGNVVETTRNRLDEHGNVIEALDANATLAGNDHRRVYTMDDTGLRVIRTEVLLEDGDGPYTLRRDVQYDPVLDLPIEATAWMVTRGGAPVDARNSLFYGYDEFARIVSRTYPGEAAGMVSEQYLYELGNPVSRVLVRSRSENGGELDIEVVQCYDGHGRGYQSRFLVDTDEYKVSGFTIFNTKGDKQEVFQAYRGTGGQCDLAPPAGTLSVRTRFDGQGRAIEQIWPDAEPGDGEEAVTRTEFLPLAEVRHDLEDTLAGGDHAGTPVVERRNGLDQTVAVERLLAPGGPPLVHEYRFDELGELVAWHDPGGHERQQEYDLLSRVIRVDDPDRGVSTIEYDAGGNPIRAVDARGVVRRLAYDGDNRLIAEWDEDDEAGTRIEYRYDVAGDCPVDQCSNLAGRLAAATYPLGEFGAGEDRHGYDFRGNPTTLVRVLDELEFKFETQYDNSGRLVGNTYPNGLHVDLELDGAGRVTRVPGYLDPVEYGERGELVGVTMANGVTTAREYDERMRLASLTATGPDASAVLAYEYRRNREGQILEVTDGRVDDGHPLGSARYTYDALYRLTCAELDPARPSHAETIEVAFDAVGNITAKTSSRGAASPAHVGDYRYGETGAGPHAVTTAGAVSLAYDAAGNLVARGGASYEWDFLGRMIRATEAGDEIARFAYGPTADRLVKREGDSTTYYVSPGFEVRDGVASVFISVDRERWVQVEDPGFVPRMLGDIAPASGADRALVAEPDGAITAGDAWLAQAVTTDLLAFAAPTRVGEVRALLGASVDRMLRGGSGDTEVRYLHADHLGGTVAVTDDAGRVVERFEYYPYGTVRHQTGELPSIGYTGKEQDGSTGLIYFGARYLDPWTGRWTATDPLFAILVDPATDTPEEATGAYPYAGGDPVNTVDEDGRFLNFLVGGIVGMVVGAVAEISVQKAKGQKISWKKVAFKSLLGAGAGALTSGFSAIGTAVGATAEITTYKVMENKGYSAKDAARGGSIANSTANVIGGIVGVISALATGDALGGLCSLVEHVGTEQALQATKQVAVVASAVGGSLLTAAHGTNIGVQSSRLSKSPETMERRLKRRLARDAAKKVKQKAKAKAKKQARKAAAKTEKARAKEARKAKKS